MSYEFTTLSHLQSIRDRFHACAQSENAERALHFYPEQASRSHLLEDGAEWNMIEWRIYIDSISMKLRIMLKMLCFGWPNINTHSLLSRQTSIRLTPKLTSWRVCRDDSFHQQQRAFLLGRRWWTPKRSSTLMKSRTEFHFSTVAWNQKIFTNAEGWLRTRHDDTRRNPYFLRSNASLPSFCSR